MEVVARTDAASISVRWHSPEKRRRYTCGVGVGYSACIKTYCSERSLRHKRVLSDWLEFLKVLCLSWTVPEI